MEDLVYLCTVGDHRQHLHGGDGRWGGIVSLTHAKARDGSDPDRSYTHWVQMLDRHDTNNPESSDHPPSGAFI